MKEINSEKNSTFDAKLFSFTAVAAIIGAGLAAGMGVSAYGGMMDLRGSEDRDAIHTALENGDYDTWSDLMETQCANGISEERFTEVSAHHKENVKNHDAIEEAIEAGDFKTWSALSSEFDRGRDFTIITEETFPKFVEMHNAMEAGDFEEADALREELGLVGPQDGSGLKNGMGRGMGNGRGMNQ